MVSPRGHFLDLEGMRETAQFPVPEISLAGLRERINDLAGVLCQILPEGCPMVLGGGIARDALMGGVPVDVDVWLPSNFNPEVLNLRFVDAFCDLMRAESLTSDRYPQIVFEGPNDINPENDPNNYRDMSNHWVIEFDHGPVKFNIMRTMSVWDGDSQAFFSSIMQNFDIDLCMMFVAAIPSVDGFFDNPIDTIILPSSIANDLANDVGITSFRWNRFRWDTTSVRRRDFRRDKIRSRYQVTEGAVLERESFTAVPVPLSFIMENQTLLPFPERPELADVRTTREAESQGFRTRQEVMAQITEFATQANQLNRAISWAEASVGMEYTLESLTREHNRVMNQLNHQRDLLNGLDPWARTPLPVNRTVSRTFGGVPPINITHNPQPWAGAVGIAPLPRPVLQAGGGVGVPIHGTITGTERATLTGTAIDVVWVEDVAAAPDNPIQWG